MFFAFRYCFFLNASEAPFNKGRQAAVRGFGGEGRAFLVAVGVGAEEEIEEEGEENFHLHANLTCHPII